VTWRSGDYLIHGARITLSGAPVGPTFQISASGVGSRDPSVAWNSTTDDFGVVYTGFSNAGATTSFARVTPAGQVIRRNTFNVGAATFITDVAFNTGTGRFVAVWSQNGTQGAEISAAGDVLGQGLVSTTTGTYDGMGLAYNPVSGTFLLVGHGPSADVWGAELNSRGARFSADTPVTSAGGPVGSFYPRAASHTSQPQWNVSFAHNFNMLRNQVVHSLSGGGGPGGGLGGAPVADPGGSPGGCPGSAPFAGAVCVNGGWVPGTGGGGGGSAGGCPGSAPFAGAVCVGGGWVPGTGGGGGRSTGGCPGTAPFAGAVCVGGGWVPGTGGGGGGSTGGCPGTTPFAGAVCVNGGWVPGSTASSCTTPDPFVAIGGGICSNGGWSPRR